MVLQVSEDISIIQQVKSLLLEIPYPVISKKFGSGEAGYMRSDNDIPHASLDQKIFDTTVLPFVGCEVLEMASPDDSSNGIEHNQPLEGSLMVECINGVASQVQSWQFMDDELSNCIHHSMNSSDCISQTFVDPAKVVSATKEDKTIEYGLQEVQEFNDARLTTLDLGDNDLHYQGVLSTLLKSSHQLILGRRFQNCNQESSFILWKKGRSRNCRKQRDANQQKLLKKILFEVPLLIKNRLLESTDDNGLKDIVCRPEADELATNPHVLSERSRREKLNERFVTLKSLIPSISKVDIYIYISFLHSYSGLSLELILVFSLALCSLTKYLY